MLLHTELTLADLTQADMSDTECDHVGFNGANLEEVNLNRAKMLVPRMRTAILCGADLSEAVIIRPVFCGTDLRGVKLDGVRIRTQSLRTLFTTKTPLKH